MSDLSSDVCSSDLSKRGSGPGGRIVKSDFDAGKAAAPAPSTQAAPGLATTVAAQDFGIPHEAVQLSSMRKTIARRLTESKQTVPHIYLTMDVQLETLLKLRSELNDRLTGSGVKLFVNDQIGQETRREKVC